MTILSQKRQMEELRAAEDAKHRALLQQQKDELARQQREIDEQVL
jgi:hypothetical protein